MIDRNFFPNPIKILDLDKKSEPVEKRLEYHKYDEKLNPKA